MRKIIFLLMALFSVTMYAQITEQPYVQSQNSNVTIYGVYVNSDYTAVCIDYQDYILRSAKRWIRIKSNTFLQYKDPDSGRFVTIKARSVERLINDQVRYEESAFDIKYDTFTDFGGRPVHWMMRVFFPPIPVGVSEISIVGENNSDLSWNGIRIQMALYPDNEDEANETLQEIIKNSKTIYAGNYEGIDIPWKLAFVEGDNHYALLNREKLVGWDIMGVWATLTPTTYPNVFKGTRHYTNRTKTNITVVFEEGIMLIREDGEEQKYIKMNDDSASSSTIANASKWSGTGFALKNGYVVTNYHVAGEAKTIEIYGVNGNASKGYKATVVGADKVSDLALLKITDKDFSGYGNPPYAFKSSMVDVGENVYVLGYPLTQTMGEEIKLTNGIISARSGYEGDVTTYQISVPVQPGNSGGPMFDMKGNLVGIVCAKHAEAENANYAIKTSYLKNLVESVASSSIFPTVSTINGKELKEQVKQIKNFVYMIKCSDMSDISDGLPLHSGDATSTSNIINYPTVKRTYSEDFRVKSVVIERDYTAITLEFIPPKVESKALNIDQNAYIVVNGTEYVMTRAEGIELAPNRSVLSRNMTFTMYFPPIPASTTSMDLIESQFSSKQFLGIKIR